MATATLGVRVYGILDNDKDCQVELARFVSFGDAMFYVRARQQHPGMLWALIVHKGKQKTYIYLDTQVSAA